jgi:hypothetical protein
VRKLKTIPAVAVIRSLLDTEASKVLTFFLFFKLIKLKTLKYIYPSIFAKTISY